MSIQPDHDTITRPEDQAILDDLGKLAVALTERGYQAQVRTPATGLPYLYARHPQVTALSERIFAQADNFFWPWADPIAARDQVTKAAATIARVLAATANSTGE